MRVKHVVQGEFGEVRLPVWGRRPLFEVIDEDNRAKVLDSAKWRLAEHTKECRRRYAHQFWNLIRVNTPIFYMANIELINHTPLPPEWVQQTVFHLCRDLHPSKTIRFVFQNTWKDIDEETGELVVVTESHEIPWEGDWWKMKEGGLVRIRLSSNTVYPVSLALKGNPPTPQRSLDLSLACPMEMFLFLAALEVRRFWQIEHPRKFEKSCKDLGIAPDLGADLYAARMLSSYRQGCEAFGAKKLNSSRDHSCPGAGLA